MVFGFFRLVFYAIVGYLIYKFVTAVLSPRPGDAGGKRRGLRSGVMVKDEVCNTYLPREDAIKETVAGVDHYFCSQACRRRFLEGGKDGAGRNA